jgi:hypothetical protein
MGDSRQVSAEGGGLNQVALDKLGSKDEPIKLLGRDDILGFSDLKYEIVPVPEWGGSVRVRSLRGVERDEYEASQVKQRGNNVDLNLINIRAGLVARSICDHSGNPVFSVGDIGLLGQKSAAALERVYEVAARLSSVTDEAIGVLAKNSGRDRSGEPSSA